MRFSLIFIKEAAWIFLVLAIHFWIINILPFPLSAISVESVFLLWRTMAASLREAVWPAIIFGYLLDLFSPVPFGANLISLLAGLFFLNWLLSSVFSNPSFAISTLAVWAGLISIQAVYLAIIAFSNLLKIEMWIPPLSYWYYAGWSLACSAVLFLVINFVRYLWGRGRRAQYLGSRPVRAI